MRVWDNLGTTKNAILNDPTDQINPALAGILDDKNLFLTGIAEDRDIVACSLGVKPNTNPKHRHVHQETKWECRFFTGHSHLLGGCESAVVEGSRSSFPHELRTHNPQPAAGRQPLKHEHRSEEHTSE